MAAKTRTLDVECPFFCEEGAVLRLDLNDMRVTCRECDKEFTAAEAADRAERKAARWAAVAAWVDEAPTA